MQRQSTPVTGGKPGLIDAHLHVWDIQARHHDWLQHEPSLNRTFTPASPELGDAGVTAAIFVEASCRENEALDEATWVQHLSDSGHWPQLAGIVAHAPLEAGSSVRPLLQQLTRVPLLVGVRRLLQDEDPGFFQNPAFLEGLRETARTGLVFDACIRHYQLPLLTRLLRTVPELQVVLDHLGKPNVASGSLDPWASDLRTLAALPNVAVKLSGLAPESDPTRPLEDQALPYLTTVLEEFGADRCMLGSDYPVSMTAGPDENGISYSGWFDLVFRSTGASETERESLSWRTAAETYDLFKGRRWPKFY